MLKNLFKFNGGEVRVRFAPSPTGPLHIGGARTALFNYIFAQQNKGKFILRIEDTDTERSKLQWVQEIIDELKWLGISWDEGPDIGGKFGPYKQSQRLDIYKKYLETLLEKGKSYYCFCSPEDLEAKRQDQMSRGLAPKYDGTCRSLTKEAAAQYLKEGKPSVIRFIIPVKKVKFADMIRGDIVFDAGLLGDIVIAKSPTAPLYHFSVVVDDALMKISHVIRGEEHLSNTIRHILLQSALGFSQPLYAHLPLILNPDRSKLSKRHGDVALKDYHQQGYLPEALVNFMVFLGWNPGTEKEIFSLHELMHVFSIEKVQKGGAVFNIQKLDSINRWYIRQKSADALAKLCAPYLGEAVGKFPPKTIEKIVKIHQSRMKNLSELPLLAGYFFQDTLMYDRALLKWQKMREDEVKASLWESAKIIAGIEHWTPAAIEKALLEGARKFNFAKGYPPENRGYLLWPLRVALSGRQASASPFEIADIFGKEKTLQRIQQAIDKLN